MLSRRLKRVRHQIRLKEHHETSISPLPGLVESSSRQVRYRQISSRGSVARVWEPIGEDDPLRTAGWLPALVAANDADVGRRYPPIQRGAERKKRRLSFRPAFVGERCEISREVPIGGRRLRRRRKDSIGTAESAAWKSRVLPAGDDRQEEASKRAGSTLVNVPRAIQHG